MCMHGCGYATPLCTFSHTETQDLPLSNDLITFDSLGDLKGITRTTEHYILVGFCKKGFLNFKLLPPICGLSAGSSGCHKLSQLLSPIATISSGLHDNLVVAMVECSPTDRLPGGLLTRHLPSVAFFDYTDKTWTEYRQKKSLDGINSFLSEMIQ